MSRIKATSISLDYAGDEGPDHTDGQHFDSLKDLNRRFSGVMPKEGRGAKVTLSDGEEVEIGADGNDWAINGSTFRGYETLNEAIDHLEVMKNELSV
jgi:hypothetical protein